MSKTNIFSDVVVAPNMTNRADEVTLPVEMAPAGNMDEISSS